MLLSSPPVPGPPTVSVVPKGPVQLKVGKSISLDCLGAGEPRALVRWSKVGVRKKVESQKLLPLESRAVLQVGEGRLEGQGARGLPAPVSPVSGLGLAGWGGWESVGVALGSSSSRSE